MEVAVFAGSTVTVGTVASLLTQYVKGSWFPKEQRAVLCRLLVACVSVALHSLYAYTQGTPLGIETLVMSFFSYVVAAAEYDHMFKGA